MIRLLEPEEKAELNLYELDADIKYLEIHFGKNCHFLQCIESCRYNFTLTGNWAYWKILRASVDHFKSMIEKAPKQYPFVSASYFELLVYVEL